jgi:hypothetical protein
MNNYSHFHLCWKSAQYAGSWNRYFGAAEGKNPQALGQDVGLIILETNWSIPGAMATEGYVSEDAEEIDLNLSVYFREGVGYAT